MSENPENWPAGLERELREEARSLDLFDASAWLGKTPAFPLMSESTPELLRAVQADACIGGALVSHWASSLDCSQDGNRLLLDAISDAPDWYAAITLNPLYPADPGSPGTPEWVWPEKVRAVRVFPKSFKYPLTSWCAGSLCEALLERRMPLFVFHSELEFRDLHELASAFPDLRIIVESHPRKVMYHVRTLLPLMKSCPNVHMEMSNLCQQRMIEYVVDTLGPERLVFGSFTPANDPWVPIGMITQAEIGDDAKRMIACGNMRRIISEVRL